MYRRSYLRFNAILRPRLTHPKQYLLRGQWLGRFSIALQYGEFFTYLDSALNSKSISIVHVYCLIFLKPLGQVAVSQGRLYVAPFVRLGQQKGIKRYQYGRKRMKSSNTLQSLNDCPSQTG